jgi:sugar lactone lactonase YvrE
MTWHLNYSRVSFLAMWSVMLDAFAAGLFALAYHRRSTFLYAAAGLVAGIAIHFYYSSRLLPLILGVVVVYWLVAERARFIRVHGVGLIACGVGFFLAAAPIGQYALLHSREFSARTETVSVFKEVEQARSWVPLINSTKAHLLMFNVHGDNNGRHNWTGRPMLDSVIGGLAVLGLGLAIVRWRRWPYAMMLAWVPIMLLGGTLSLSWEAPQSHRAVEEVTAIAVLAALPLALLWRAADAVPVALAALAGGARRVAVASSPSGEAALPFGGSGPIGIWAPGSASAVAEPAARPDVEPVAEVTTAAPMGPVSRIAEAVARLFGVVVIGLVVAAGILNIQRYFGPQMADNRTWLEFSTPQTMAGRWINEVPVDWRIYVDPVFLGNPTLHFMVKGDRQFTPFDPATSLPITEPAAMVFLSNREPSAAARVAQFYPAAPRRLVMPPQGDEIGLYAFTLTPEEVQEAEGVTATYRGAEGPVRRREQRLEFDWSANQPLPAPFAATFETTLAAPTQGSYRFRVEAPGEAALLVDGAPIAGPGLDGEVLLARGVHAVRLEVPEAGTGAARVLWAPPNQDFGPIPANALHVPPVRTTGLLARLYRGTEAVGEPALAKVDPAVELRVHAMPLARPYTIEWTGAVRAHRDGTYKFATTSVDASAVWIDGQQIIDNRHPNAPVEGTVNLSAGWHDIRVRFLDATSFTHITLYWQPPEEGRRVVPTDALRPWEAERVAMAYPEDMDLSRRDAPAMAAASRRSAGPGARMLASSSILVQPRGVAIAPDGTVYIADAGRPGVVVVPPEGEARVLAEGQFREPSAVAILPDRTIAVVDAGAAMVWRVQADGTVLERLAPTEGLYGPRGIAAAADGTIAIADTGNNRVLLVLPNGTTQSIRNLKEPTDAAFLSDGNLLVADTGTKSLRIMKRNGESVSSWSMPTAFTVVGPHVAVVPGGGWVATAPEARGLLRFPPNGRSPDTWDLGVAWQKPVGIAASRAGIVVADSDAATVVLIGLP